MTRGDFLQIFAKTTGGCFLAPSFSAQFAADPGEVRRVIAALVEAPTTALPPAKRIPLGWRAFALPASADSSELVVIRFPRIKAAGGQVWLRLATAIDLREEYLVGVFLGRTPTRIGSFDIKYAHPFQPFQITIAPQYLPAISREGVALRLLKGSKDAWFFRPEPDRPESAGLQPHLLIGAGGPPEKAFLKNLFSLNALSPFGWLGGCVMDGLYALHQGNCPGAKDALTTYLHHFLDPQHGIRFENPNTEPLDGSFNSIEDFLPFACIAALYPGHASIQKATDFLLSRKNTGGIIMSGQDVTTEGCYTVAYPLAAIAGSTGDKVLAQIALDQLKHRTQLLHDEGAIYQRASPSKGQTFRNWGRGIAWYLLGMVKTICILEKGQLVDWEGIKTAKSDFVRAIELVGPWQNEAGYWSSFIDRPQTGEETSATAGIAAAIALGVKAGMLDKSLLVRAQKAYPALLSRLTPDGFLTGVAQLNRGGEHLQANGYRVMAQYGMGLMAQLKAALPG